MEIAGFEYQAAGAVLTKGPLRILARVVGNTSESSRSRPPVTVKSPRPAVHGNVSKSAMRKWICSPKWPHSYRSQTTIPSVRRILQSVVVCSMLFTDGLVLHLVGKRQLLVY